MKLKKLSKFQILGLAILGAITTSLTHIVKFYKEHETIFPHDAGNLVWTHQGLPFPYHHEALVYSHFAIHDWVLYLFNTIFWASVWLLLILLVLKLFKRQ